MSLSHEQLYAKFAEQLGEPNVLEYVTDELSYKNVHNFVKSQCELVVLHADDFDFIWSAYTAIEALDNVDYKHLLQMAEGVFVSEEGLEFFRVHMLVQHYEVATPLLLPIWVRDDETVRRAFSEVANLQLQAWKNLSAAYF